MAPSKPRAGQDHESRSDGSSTKERVEKSSGSNAKGRRTAGASSSLRDVTNASATSGAAAAANAATNEPPSMQWSTMNQEMLHSYRYAYQLNTPDAFTSEYSQLILSRPGIGRFSPTMARKKNKRRQGKGDLANSVRKHFNGIGIHENEAIVSFLYKCEWQDKNFRMKFSPQAQK